MKITHKECQEILPLFSSHSPYSFYPKLCRALSSLVSDASLFAIYQHKGKNRVTSSTKYSQRMREIVKENKNWLSELKSKFPDVKLYKVGYKEQTLGYLGYWQSLGNPKKTEATVEKLLPIINLAAYNAKLFSQLKTRQKKEHKIQSITSLISSFPALVKKPSAVAHEFNNILLSIIGQLSLIEILVENEVPKEQILEELATIKQLARDGEIIVSRLKQKSTPNNEKKPVNVRDLIEETLRITKAKLKEEDKEITLEHLPLQDAEVLASSTELREVLFNLINNAVEAIDGKGKITIGTKIRDKKISILISDTGKGLNPSEIDKVFLPYYSTKAEGSGLGLSISQRIISSYGGNISFDSTPGKGTVSIVTLPIYRNHTHQQQNRKIRVVVLGDKKETVQNLISIIRKMGYKVCGTESVSDMAKVLKDNKADVAIVDDDISNTHSIELQRKLKEIQSDLKFGLISTRLDILTSQMKSHSSSTFNIEDLVRIVSTSASPKRLAA